MIVESIKCDSCGKVKGEANHWLLGMKAYSASGRCWGYSIGKWDDEYDECSHFCGRECALKALFEHLEATPDAHR